MELKNLLIVDDTRFFLDILSEGFKQQGINVFTAANGTEALTILDNKIELVDVVLTDYFLPDLNGFKILEYFCKKKQTGKKEKIIGFIYSSKEEFSPQENVLLKKLPVKRILKSEDPEKLIKNVLDIIRL